MNHYTRTLNKKRKRFTKNLFLSSNLTRLKGINRMNDYEKE